MTCDRCLKSYDFPQARLREQNKNFYYRVVGPFSVPDYGRGSYASLLALRVINRFNMTMHELTFATAMDLAFDGNNTEVDFLAWRRDDQLDYDEPPQFIIGEAKSGERKLIKARNLAQLKALQRSCRAPQWSSRFCAIIFYRPKRNCLKHSFGGAVGWTRTGSQQTLYYF